MNFNIFEQIIITLCEDGKFDEAEIEKKKAMPHIRVLLKNGDGAAQDYLKLFSQLAGEAESFENFSSFLDELVSDGLVEKSYADELLGDSPANRWL